MLVDQFQKVLFEEFQKKGGILVVFPEGISEGLVGGIAERQEEILREIRKRNFRGISAGKEILTGIFRIFSARSPPKIPLGIPLECMYGFENSSFRNFPEIYFVIFQKFLLDFFRFFFRNF